MTKVWVVRGRIQSHGGTYVHIYVWKREGNAEELLKYVGKNVVALVILDEDSEDACNQKKTE